MQRWLNGYALLAVGFLTAPLAAQFIDYQPFGETIRSNPIDNRALIDAAIDNSRWDFGPLRLSPIIDFDNVAFTTGVTGEEETDLALTVRAGLFGVVPIGSNVALTAEVAPGYVWYKNDSERSVYHERFAADFYAFLNRLQIHGGASRLDDSSLVSPEISTYVSRHVEEIRAEIDLRAYRSLHVFLEGGVREERELEDQGAPSILSRLDRQETVLQAGFRLLRGAASSIELGLEISQSDFVDVAPGRSNEGTYPFVGAVMAASRNRLRARVAFRDLEPADGSGFAGFDSLTGFVSLEHNFGARTILDFRIRQNIGYGLEADNSHYESRRFEVQFRMPIYRRVSWQLSSEIGPDDYFRIVEGDVSRTDDVVGLGTSFLLPMGERTTLTVGYRVLDYDSSDPLRTRKDKNIIFSFAVSAFGRGLSVR